MAILRNLLAVVIGLVIGAGINMAIIVVGPNLIPPPQGVDASNMESIRASLQGTLLASAEALTPNLN